MVENRCKKVCTSKSDLRSNDFSIVGSLPRDFELSNFDCYGKPVEVTGAIKSQKKTNKKPPPPKPVIPAAAKRVDLYARALFPFSFLFFNVVYWSTYLWTIDRNKLACIVIESNCTEAHKWHCKLILWTLSWYFILQGMMLYFIPQCKNCKDLLFPPVTVNEHNLKL